MRNFIVTFFVIILLSNNSFAEMKNTKILNSIFNGCIGNSQQVDGKNIFTVDAIQQNLLKNSLSMNS